MRESPAHGSEIATDLMGQLTDRVSKVDGSLNPWSLQIFEIPLLHTRDVDLSARRFLRSFDKCSDHVRVEIGSGRCTSKGAARAVGLTSLLRGAVRYYSRNIWTLGWCVYLHHVS
jgi:hypothetical protein